MLLCKQSGWQLPALSHLTRVGNGALACEVQLAGHEAEGAQRRVVVGPGAEPR